MDGFFRILEKTSLELCMIIEVEFESWNGFCSIVVHNLAGLTLILEGMKQISGSENTSILISDIRSVFQRLK